MAHLHWLCQWLKTINSFNRVIRTEVIKWKLEKFIKVLHRWLSDCSKRFCLFRVKCWKVHTAELMSHHPFWNVSQIRQAPAKLVAHCFFFLQHRTTLLAQTDGLGPHRYNLTENGCQALWVGVCVCERNSAHLSRTDGLGPHRYNLTENGCQALWVCVCVWKKFSTP